MNRKLAHGGFRHGAAGGSVLDGGQRPDAG